MSYREFATDLARCHVELVRAEVRHLDPPTRYTCAECYADAGEAHVESALGDYTDDRAAVRTFVATHRDELRDMFEAHARSELEGETRPCETHHD